MGEKRILPMTAAYVNGYVIFRANCVPALVSRCWPGGKVKLNRYSADNSLATLWRAGLDGLVSR